MTSKIIRDAWRNMMRAMLRDALNDLTAVPSKTNVGTIESNRRDAIVFARSEWCEKLCLEVNIDYPSYLKKANELYEKNFED